MQEPPTQSKTTTPVTTPTRTPAQAPGARSAPRARRVGLAAALSVAAVILIVLTTMVIRGGNGPEVAQADTTPPPEIIDIGSGGGGRSGSIQLTDPENPSIVQAEITYSALDPLGGGRYAVTQPTAWIYLNDGQRLHVQGDSGRFLMIGEERADLDSGSITGNVRILMFDSQALINNDAPDPLLALARADTDTLAFDMTTGELSTPNELKVTSDTIDFKGVGVRALISEVRQRIELLVVRGGGEIRYRPETQTNQSRYATNTDAQASPNTPPTPGDAPPSRPGIATTPTPDPVELRYLAVLNDNILIKQGSRTIDADRLDVWARLIDGSLPTRTTTSHASHIALPISSPLGLASLAIPAAAITQISDQTSSRLDSLDDSPDPLSESIYKEVVLTWTGQLEARPVADTPDPPPQQLVNDDLYVRLTAERTGRVRFADSLEQVSGVCPSLSFGATTKQVALSGPGPSAVEISASGKGRLSAGRIVGNTASGIAHIPGPGLLEAFPEGENEPDRGRISRIAWTDQADFIFQTNNRQATPRLQEAMFTGNVDAADGPTESAASLRAGFVRTIFSATDSPVENNQSNSPSIQRIIATDNITGSDGSGGKLTCRDSLEVLFDTTTATSNTSIRNAPTPNSITARGDVLVHRDSESLRSELLEAQLSIDPDGRTIITDLLAQQSVSLTAADGVSAQTTTLRAKPESNQAVLSGEGSRVQRGDTIISGSAIELDGLTRRVRVQSAGTFTHDPNIGTAVQAEWSKDMLYDDQAGTLDCSGSVNAIAQGVDAAGGSTNDVITAERIQVRFEDLESSDTNYQTEQLGINPDQAFAGKSRDVQTLIAWGGVLDNPQSAPAKIESRRYAPGEPKKLLRLTYLEGSQILAHKADQTISVPGPGRLLIADHAEPTNDDDKRGDTLLEWTGSMLLEQSTGHADVKREVRLTHRRRLDGELTDLECERLDITVSEDAGSGGTLGRLRNALAEGAVYLSSGSRELIADVIRYNADTGQARAEALGDGRVTIFDSTKPAPISARELNWDLATDRIELTDPGSISAPR